MRELQKGRRKYNEGGVATVMIAAINISFAVGMFTRNRGTFRAALDSIGLLEEWSVGCIMIALLLLFGLMRRMHGTIRYWSLIAAALWGGASATMVAFYAPHLFFSPFGMVVLCSCGGATALLWLHVRGEAYQGRRELENAR